MPIGSSEAEIRQKILQSRKSMPESDLFLLSERLVFRFLQFSGIDRLSSRTLRVGIYSSMRGEVYLQSLIKWMAKVGWKIHFPRVVNRENSEIELVELPSLVESNFWKPGPFGILEPHPDFKACNPNDLDLLIVPGVAFGESGERIGMGAGYYDRFLAPIPSVLRIALAFDFQLFQELPQNSWDQSMHWIWTEKREVKTSFLDLWWKKWEN